MCSIHLAHVDWDMEGTNNKMGIVYKSHDFLFQSYISLSTIYVSTDN